MALVLACSSGLEGVERTEVSPEELLAGAVLGAIPGMSAPVTDEQVLAVTPEMRAFLDDHVHRKAADQVKLHELIDAIINTKTFALEFDDRTRTASEAFERRTGNCLSFSNLFVAMAREVDLAASFQEVDLPPDWSLDNDVFVLNRHVNVRVDLDPLGAHVVDFNIDDFRASYETRTISDTRARAHYFNNMGVEAMQAGDAATAVGLLSEGPRRQRPRVLTGLDEPRHAVPAARPSRPRRGCLPAGAEGGPGRARRHEQPGPPLRAAG